MLGEIAFDFIILSSICSMIFVIASGSRRLKAGRWKLMRL
jgi:hypothetical protein